MSKADALAVMREAGFLLDAVQWDAGLQRCPIADKPRKKNGAYIAHSDAPASLWWYHWATGQSGTWTEKPEKQLSAGERKALHERIALGRRAFEEKQGQRHANAALRAQKLYAAAAHCADHPYLTAKGAGQTHLIFPTTARKRPRRAPRKVRRLDGPKQLLCCAATKFRCVCPGQRCETG